mgnify:CR=1 FL=1
MDSNLRMIAAQDANELSNSFQQLEAAQEILKSQYNKSLLEKKNADLQQGAVNGKFVKPPTA